MAFFVEGQAEQMFVSKLIQEVANRNLIRLELFKITHGRSVPRRINTLPPDHQVDHPTKL